MPKDQNENAEARRPAYEVKAGMVVGSVWLNGKAGEEYFTATVAKLYNANKDKDAKPEWQRSHSFGLLDLPLVEKVSGYCFAWMIRQHNKDRE